MIKEKIEKLLKNVLKEWLERDVFFQVEKEIKVEHPEKETHGDYASNLALVLAKYLNKNPFEIGREISENVKIKNSKLFEKVEVVQPGFLNFFLKEKIFFEEIKKILKEKEKYGQKTQKKKRTMIIDYSSPNIAKPFGIGHLRSTIIGQAIYNVYKFLGWKVIGDNHLGDWGTQFGKLIYQIKKTKKDPTRLTIEEMEKLYVQFHQEAEKNPTIEEEGRRWFQKLEKGDKEAKKIWQICVKVSLKEFSRIYQILGVKIDYALGESFYEPMLKEIIEEAKRKKIAKESEGALVIEYPKKTNLPPAIILKSDGATTYFTRDLATIKYRIKRWRPDLIVYEVGAEQTLHFRQLFEAVNLFGWSKKTKFVHIAHGLYRKTDGKFSTRRGETVHLEDILEEAIKRAKKILEQSEAGKKFSEKEKEKIAKIVGIGAIKYNDLSHHYSGDIIFDWEKMLNLKGNSAPYLQYTFVRCQSVLKKSKEKIELRKLIPIPLLEEEKNVLKTIFHFPEVVEEAAERFSPNLICNFAFDLAQKYNLFYDSLPILLAKEKERRILRLALTQATAQILKNSLSLLGIDLPDKM